MRPFTSTISVSRLAGAVGENCQWRIAWPGAVPQNAMLATRNLPYAQSGQPPKNPDAKARLPGSVVSPLKMQESGPLHTSFCSTVSKVVRSGVTVLVSTQPGEPAFTFCIRELVKVR